MEIFCFPDSSSGPRGPKAAYISKTSNIKLEVDSNSLLGSQLLFSLPEQKGLCLSVKGHQRGGQLGDSDRGLLSCDLIIHLRVTRWKGLPNYFKTQGSSQKGCSLSGNLRDVVFQVT